MTSSSENQGVSTSATMNAHAQNVFKAFGYHNMQDYHILYLKSDVAILEDIF